MSKSRKLPPEQTKDLIILMPTRGTVCVETVNALVNNQEGHRIHLITEDRLDVDDARNRLVAKAIFVQQKDISGRFSQESFVFWIDSDAYFIEGTLTMMMRRLEENTWLDLLVPFSGPRAPLSQSHSLLHADTPVDPQIHSTDAGLIEIEYASTHCMLHRLSLLHRLGPTPFGASTATHMTEDYFFSETVRKSGGRIALDPAIPVFHIDERTGNAYLPSAPTMKIVNNVVDVYGEYVTQELGFEQRSYGKRVDTACEIIRTIRGNEIFR